MGLTSSSWAALASLFVALWGTLPGVGAKDAGLFSMRTKPLTARTVGDTTSYPLLFETMTIFTGTWFSENNTRQLDVFGKNNGNVRCQFALNDNNDKLFRLEAIDGVYLDQLKVLVEFNLSMANFSNLTNSTLYFNNSLNTTIQSVNTYKLKYMSVETYKENVAASLTIKFLNKSSGEGFNLQASDYSVLSPHPESRPGHLSLLS